MSGEESRETASASVGVRTDSGRSEPGRVWIVPAAVGAVAFALAVVVLLVPGRYVPQVGSEVGSVVRLVLLAGSALGGIGGLYLLLIAPRRTPTDQTRSPTGPLPVGGDPAEPIELPARTRENLGSFRGASVGRQLDEELDRIDGLVDPESRTDTTRARKIRDNLRELAIRVLVSETNCSRSEAQERIETGSWTENRRAAAFLSEHVRLPIDVRLRDWANGATFDRQVEATVEALAGRMGVDRQ